jgi:hypothetical protein
MQANNEFVTIDIYRPASAKQQRQKQVHFELDNSCGGPLNCPYQPEITHSMATVCLKKNKKIHEPRLITPSPYETCRLNDDQKEMHYLRENTNLFIV